MKEALSSSETSVLTRATRRNIPEDTILHSHHRENLRSYIMIPNSHFILCPVKNITFQNLKSGWRVRVTDYSNRSQDVFKQFSCFVLFVGTFISSPIYYVGFEVLIAVLWRVHFFCDITPCRPLKVTCFEEKFRHHLQGRINRAWSKWQIVVLRSACHSSAVKMETVCWSVTSVYLFLPASLGPVLYSASNRNEYRRQK
jgi:hypothetical protein